MRKVDHSVEFRIGKGNLVRLYGDYIPTKEELIADSKLYASKNGNIKQDEFYELYFK